MSINLIDNQWILVRDQKDNVKEVSLKECLLNCENFLELAGETVAQDAALLRLLIAMNLTVMYRWDKNGEQSLLETEDQALDRWQAVWESGHLQKRAITEYLESVKDSFELDGDGKRFLQSENAKIGTSYKSSKLMGDLSESNNKLRLFQLRNGEAKEELSLACSARWLLNLNGFDDTSSKSSTKYKLLPKEERLSPGAGWLGKIGLVFVKGQNLFETIMLNTILLKDGKTLWPSVVPYWEVDNPDISERRMLSGVPDDLAALLTMPSRRLWLNINPDNKVDGYYLIGGDFFERTNAFTEQYTLWKKADPKKKDSNDFVPRRHQAARQLWRDFQFFALPTTEKKTKAPGVIDWVRTLLSQEIIDDESAVELFAPSVTYGDKDFFITDVSSQSIRFFPDVLMDAQSEWRDAIQSEIEKIDQLAFAAGIFAKEIALASGASPDIASSALTGASNQFYANIDQLFQEWISSIHPDEIEDLEQYEQVLREWHRTAAKIGYQTSKLYLSGLRPEALLGKYVQDKKKEVHVSIPEAIERLNWKIYSIYKKNDAVENDVD